MKLCLAFLLVVLVDILPPLTIADETDLDLEGVLTIESSSIVRLEINNYHPEECQFFLCAVSIQSEAALLASLGISLRREVDVFPDDNEEIFPGSSIVTDVAVLPLFDFYGWW
jgi:hypothetical protein